MVANIFTKFTGTIFIGCLKEKQKNSVMYCMYILFLSYPQNILHRQKHRRASMCDDTNAGKKFDDLFYVEQKIQYPRAQ